MQQLSYIILSKDKISEIDFSELIGNSKDARTSLDGTLFITKWVTNSPTLPASIEALPAQDKGDILTHAEAKNIMRSEAWQNPQENE